MTQQPELPHPRWLRPTLITALVVLLVLALLIDVRQSPDENAPWLARLAAVLIIALVWMVELLRVGLPRPVLVLVVAAPVTWLNVVREGTASLPFLFLAVAWAT